MQAPTITKIRLLLIKSMMVPTKDKHKKNEMKEERGRVRTKNKAKLISPVEQMPP